VPIKHYLQNAEKMMNNAAVKRYLTTHTNPSLDPLMRMRREADVVRYGNEQLASHVNHALFAGIGSQIECLSEYGYEKSRPDKVWREASVGGARRETFAVFESKIKATINSKELGVARLLKDENPKGKIESAIGSLSKTHFSGKSLSIMAQAAKYFRHPVFNTNYVALFDSDYLFLCVFSQDSAYSVKGTLIPCQGVEGKGVRRALLGWLLEAWEKQLAGQNTRAPTHPAELETESDMTTAANPFARQVPTHEFTGFPACGISLSSARYPTEWGTARGTPKRGVGAEPEPMSKNSMRF
jgi:hypothetical protein